ncbi:SDR family NAD(P)-dependent oxidoreductase [Alteromonas mediterranea]|uniref:SDR family NAD(P)-dependent oxidoreductase n=1 Tax=Alteromonas mediterranea TaxID=314275 RepID=UPI00035576B1|nr:SDR family oxidoreductase [Alteromonas mediterranea]AGP86153.1 short-chain dehydrogenase/reductase family protein [Alteromonas mediterranea U4]AGP90291.1 short-chain dehydrogenase/reductase family protein [Alteromonas mediterranea U7]AGP94112.1 short-chain dehydrogenase/reductase family protein [Alteromonas mediterranea U8]
MAIALITGGSRGLGRAGALALAKKGVDVVITYNTNQAAADEVVKEIQSYGRKASALPLNTADSHYSFPEFLITLKQVLKSQFGKQAITYLINNAGIGLNASFAATSIKQFDTLFDMHVKGPYFLTQTLLPIIEDGGAILNISFGLARFCLPGNSAYGMAKGAVEVMTRYLAAELGNRNIRVNTLAPGAVETDFGGGYIRDNSEVNNAIASQTALGRVGKPEDIGGVMAALLSDDCYWVNGHRIEASGGMKL